MRARGIKTGWHLLLAGAALLEWQLARSEARKLLLGGAAGWHLAAAWLDWHEAPRFKAGRPARVQ